MNTPWGASQYQKKLGEGIILVSTAGHGGLMIRQNVAQSRLTPQAIARGWNFGGYFCYEEDCLIAIPCYELGLLMSKEDALSTISMWDADYLIERGIEPEPKAYSYYLQWQEREHMEKENHPDLIVSASGDWHTKRPGVVEVITADHKHHFVTAESYDKRTGLNLLSKCVLAE